MSITNERNSIKKKFLLDISLSIFSSAIAASLLQFLVYPIIGNKFNQITFGEILTIMGIINIIAVMLGNSLNNIRLIVNNDYYDNKIKGDFIPLLCIASILNISLIILVSVFFSNSSSIFILILISLLTMLRSYLEVAYRLIIDYKIIFYHSLVYCIGLLIGVTILIYWTTGLWEIVFLSGEIFSLIFLIFTADLHKEPMKITFRFKSTLKQYTYLAFSSLIGNILVYLDRLIILPVLGGRQVAVYFAATLIGKMSSFIIQPISGVLLTYFSKSNRRIKVNEFWLINLLLIVFSIFALFLSVILSSFILKHLYPNLYYETLEILYLGNLAAILSATSSITQAIILKYCATIWQTVIQTTYGMIYVTCGIILMNYYGLVGFCIAAIIAIVIKILFMIIVGTISLRHPHGSN